MKVVRIGNGRIDNVREILGVRLEPYVIRRLVARTLIVDRIFLRSDSDEGCSGVERAPDERHVWLARCTSWVTRFGLGLARPEWKVAGCV